MSTIFTSSTQLACAEEKLEQFLAKPRHTLSARKFNERFASAVLSSPRAGARAPSGAEQLRAVFCSLPQMTQHQVRQLAYERIVLEAKMAASRHRRRSSAS